MARKTPKFDQAIDEILDKAKPGVFSCKQCLKDFKVLDADIDFYKSFRVPLPTLCPQCRMQRRLAWRVSTLPIFYKKQCGVPGHNEKVVTFYSKDSPVKVYDDDYYISDNWDALEFGLDYDKEKSFFEQFNELAKTTPHQTLQRDYNSVNCRYTISGQTSKNCYYITIPYHSEDVYYGYLAAHSKNSLDMTELDNSDNCYDTIYLRRCHNCNYCIDCHDCLDSYFLFDCRNCSNCFGSSNLRNKKYVFFNQQLTKEEYQKAINKFDLGSRKVIGELKEKFAAIVQGAIHKHVNNLKVENVRGDLLEGCKDCYYAFRSTAGSSEAVRYAWSFDNVSDVMDIFGVGKASRVYESTAVIEGGDIKFSVMARGGLGSEYSMECNNCDYCFGCFGLRNKKFCIFNKQYSEGEYWQKVDEIKTKMLRADEYGEFFSVKMSPFPYNVSNAGMAYPLSRDEVLSKGWKWGNGTESDVLPEGQDTLSTKDIPDNIKDVGDDILKKTIICEKSGRPFRLVDFELNFYRSKNIPVPTIHPLERVRDRYEHTKPYYLWPVKCAKCSADIETTYDPKKKFKIYCTSCYQKEVI